jgi:uncharacterized protein YdbL (DUF1318 family)
LDPPPTNDLIAQLEGRLSPDGHRALKEINALELKFATTQGAQGPSVEEALGVLDALSARDRGLVSQILQPRGRAYEERAAEYLEDSRQALLGASVIERAQELERGVGREPEERMTLGEALEIFRAHGEPVPEHLDLERLMRIKEE